MNLLGFTIARTDTIEAMIDERAAQVLDRYAHNQKALRAGLVAYNNLYDEKSIPDDSIMLKWMSRAIEAFAASVTRERSAIRRETLIRKQEAARREWPVGRGVPLQFFPRQHGVAT